MISKALAHSGKFEFWFHQYMLGEVRLVLVLLGQEDNLGKLSVIYKILDTHTHTHKRERERKTGRQAGRETTDREELEYRFLEESLTSMHRALCSSPSTT